MARSEEAALVSGDEVKLYTIHVSSKYLNLTRQKLELTRLPHNVPRADKVERWEPKETVEPLVDYWLEKYSWRKQEAEFNANIPQFRTAIQTTTSDGPVRLHFIHSPSAHANAIPLLLIPPFPFTNLSVRHLVGMFTTPDDASKDIPFHLVIPSLPGLGFSDAITSNERMIPQIAELFDTLMRRVGYPHYLATTATPSPNAVSDIDWRVINHISTSYTDSCLGVHFVSPVFKAPTLQSDPMEWIKWKTARMVSKPMLGYSHEDFQAFRQQSRRPKRESLVPEISVHKVFETNTLAYALCDSPTGLLFFVLMVLKTLGPTHQLSRQEIIQIAELTWLPGPEGTMRLLAHSASNTDDLKTSSKKPTVGITIFEDSQSTTGDQESRASLCDPSPIVHTCLAWGRSNYNIVSQQRVPGSPGLLVWERPEVVAAGVRKLAKAIVAKDNRLQRSRDTPETLLKQAVVGGDNVTPGESSRIATEAEGMSRLPKTDRMAVSEERQAGGNTKKTKRRPPTPIFPFAGESSYDVGQDNEYFSQGSSAGSPSTIKPARRIS